MSEKIKLINSPEWNTNPQLSRLKSLFIILQCNNIYQKNIVKQRLNERLYILILRSQLTSSIYLDSITHINGTVVYKSVVKKYKNLIILIQLLVYLLYGNYLSISKILRSVMAQNHKGVTANATDYLFDSYSRLWNI